ncbi:MAG: iron-only hydrogenase system regulator [Oscillospiraceae bacterium]|nr:iron-only hydrogenase system regulator [Oscillospiraceae bacterium]
MENNNRVATVAMIIDDSSCIEQVNDLLHEYSRYIIGRMGVPYREKGLNIINVVLDAPADAISALSGKLGRLQGVTAKAVYAKQAQNA